MVIGSVVVTNQWRRYTIGFESKLAMNGIGRFALAMDRATGVVLVRNCSLRRSEQGGLAAGEALPSISLLGETELATHARANDYLSFLADTDRAYLGAMRTAVREAVPRRLVAVAGTQMDFGGLLNLDSHAEMAARTIKQWCRAGVLLRVLFDNGTPRGVAGPTGSHRRGSSLERLGYPRKRRTAGRRGSRWIRCGAANGCRGLPSDSGDPCLIVEVPVARIPTRLAPAPNSIITPKKGSRSCDAPYC